MMYNEVNLTVAADAYKDLSLDIAITVSDNVYLLPPIYSKM